MNRFVKSPRRRLRLPGFLLSISLCLGAVLLLLVGVSQFSQSTQEKQLHSLEKAVRRATVQCYALEGRYPPGLPYLEEHYALLVDHRRFLVHYACQGENLMPEIQVFPLVKGGNSP